MKKWREVIELIKDIFITFIDSTMIDETFITLRLNINKNLLWKDVYFCMNDVMTSFIFNTFGGLYLRFYIEGWK